MYKKIKANNYNIHFIKTDKYKTITLKINFKRKLKKEEVTIRNLLIDTLFSSTKKYQTKRLMEIETENLYGLAYRGFVFQSGIYSILSLEETFLADKYTDNTNTINSIDFIWEVLFNPNIDSNGFKKDGFDYAYNNLKAGIISTKENTNLYSQMRLTELLDDPIISIHNVGNLSDLEKINPKNLYEYYLDILKNDNIDIYVIGDIDLKIINYIKDKFNFNNRDKYLDEHIYKPSFYHKKVNEYIESNKTNQSKLVMGLKLMDLTDFERRYVLNIYNYILGGSCDSKLFKNVREKESLCYSISSQTFPLTCLLLIRAGIDADNYSKTVKLIKKELDNINNNQFSDLDIQNGIKTYISGLKELKDSPNGLISYYMSIDYVHADNYNNKIKNIKKVNRDDIINLSKKVKLDTIYLLKGDIND